MMKSTGIVRKTVYTNEGKIGIIKDLIIETGSDWRVSHIEIELDETFKKELVAAKKLKSNDQAATFTLKITGFDKDTVNFTENGLEIKTTKAQAGDNIGTLDAFVKPTIAKPNITLKRPL